MNIRATYQNLAVLQPPLPNETSPKTGQQRASVDDSRQQARVRAEERPTDFVYRGELIDAVSDQRREHHAYYQGISPLNRIAIERYHSSQTLDPHSDPRGRLLDQYI